jgi:osmotically inducible protein OsmC
MLQDDTRLNHMTYPELPMTEKSATVHWEGNGRQGVGAISTETSALDQYPYGFGSRFGDQRNGTNPEELLAAAHAACITMAFAFACEKAGFTATAIDTRCSARLSKVGDGFLVDRLALTMKASVPGLAADRFHAIAQQVKRDCPLSKALASVPEIALDAALLP